MRFGIDDSTLSVTPTFLPPGSAAPPWMNPLLITPTPGTGPSVVLPPHQRSPWLLYGAIALGALGLGYLLAHK